MRTNKLIVVFVILGCASCTAWKSNDVSSPTGRYVHNLAASWQNQTVLDEDGNEQTLQVEEATPRYIDLVLYKRRFEKRYYKEGHDSIVEFVQSGLWYMAMQGDSLFVVLNFKKSKNTDRLFFNINAESGYYDELLSFPEGGVYQKTEKLF